MRPTNIKKEIILRVKYLFMMPWQRSIKMVEQLSKPVAGNVSQVLRAKCSFNSGTGSAIRFLRYGRKEKFPLTANNISSNRGLKNWSRSVDNLFQQYLICAVENGYLIFQLIFFLCILLTFLYFN